jgi:hypothetical protein
MPVVYTKDKQIDGYGKPIPISEPITIVIITENDAIYKLGETTTNYTLSKKDKIVVDSFHYRFQRMMILNYIKDLKLKVKQINIYDKTGLILLRSYDKNFKKVKI